jgi:hypothetical protein
MKKKVHVRFPEGTVTDREHEIIVALLFTYYFTALATAGVEAGGVRQDVDDLAVAETKRFGEASFAGAVVTFT